MVMNEMPALNINSDGFNLNKVGYCLQVRKQGCSICGKGYISNKRNLLGAGIKFNTVFAQHCGNKVYSFSVFIGLL